MAERINSLKSLGMFEGLNGEGLLESWQGIFAQAFSTNFFQEIISFYQETEINIPDEVKSFIDKNANQIMLFFSGLPAYKANAEAAEKNLSAFGTPSPDAPGATAVFQELVDAGHEAHGQLWQEAEDGRLFLEGIKNFIRYLAIPFQMNQAKKLKEKKEALMADQEVLSATNTGGASGINAVVETANENFVEANEQVEEEETQLGLLFHGWVNLLDKVEQHLSGLKSLLGDKFDINLSSDLQAEIDHSLPVAA